MLRGAWCSSPRVLPLSFTEASPPHTHTHTHTPCQVSIPQQPLILSLKHKGLAASYPLASYLGWLWEGKGPWSVSCPSRVEPQHQTSPPKAGWHLWERTF